MVFLGEERGNVGSLRPASRRKPKRGLAMQWPKRGKKEGDPRAGTRGESLVSQFFLIGSYR